MTNGRLTKPGLLASGVAVMQADLYLTVQLWRRVGQEDSLIATFRTRIAATAAAGEGGRDGQSVRGNDAARMFVCHVPLGVTVLKDDEVWEGTRRYRVVAVDAYPHFYQVILKAIQ